MTRTSDSPRSHDQTAMDNFDDSTKVSRVSSSPSLRRPFLSAERARLLPGTRAGACACQRVRPQHDEHVLGQVSVSHHHVSVSLISSRCITSTPGSRFARGEESCLANCVERFLDTSIFIVSQVQRQQQQLQQSHEASSS